jgi:hypothetical protein
MNEKLSKFFGDPLKASITSGVVSLSIGITIGYLFGKRNKPRKTVVHRLPDGSFDHEWMSNEISKLEAEHRARLPLAEDERNIIRLPLSEEENPFDENGERVIAIIDQSRSCDTAMENVEDEEERLSYLARLDPEHDEWNYEIEVRNRNPDFPYVIHHDEFFADEMDFTQSTFTYYSGDDIMTDEDESPVYNYKDKTGPLLFGHGSGDPNVVHVRNEKLKAEYEILFDPGMYSIEVLGLELEDNQRVKHLKNKKEQNIEHTRYGQANHPAKRKFKMD